MREPEGQLARWLEKLGEYDFKVVHRPGRCHENADVLSRRPCRSTCPCNLKNPILSSPQLCHQAVQCDFDGKPVNNVPTAVTTESCQVGVVQHAVTASTSSFSGWTTEELCAAQAVDPDIAPIQRWMNESMERPSWEDVSPYGPATKAYWSQWQRLYLKDGTLVRRYYLNETLSLPQIISASFPEDVCTRCTRGQWWTFVGSERYSGCRTGIIGTNARGCLHFGVPQHQLCCKGSTIKSLRRPMVPCEWVRPRKDCC